MTFQTHCQRIVRKLNLMPLAERFVDQINGPHLLDQKQ